MSKYQVKGRFSTVIVIDGRNVQIAFDAGTEVELEDDMVALISQDLGPGYLVPVKPKAKVKTATGATPKAKTRQVAGTKTPKV